MSCSKVLGLSLLLFLGSPAAPEASEKRSLKMDSLEDRWSNLAERLEWRGSQEGVTLLFEGLAARYREPHRAYHTLAHVEHVLREFDGVRHLANDPDAVELALWFHDVVYDLGSGSNEEDSAALARAAALEMGMSEARANRASSLVLATKHNAVPTDADARLVVDIDLSILGQPREQFDAYEIAIRTEYSPVIDERGVVAFNAGRAGILRRFLERATIYSTDFFRTKYEEAARSNLRHSIRQLEDPVWTEGAAERQNRPDS